VSTIDQDFVADGFLCLVLAALLRLPYLTYLLRLFIADRVCCAVAGSIQYSKDTKVELRYHVSQVLLMEFGCPFAVATA